VEGVLHQEIEVHRIVQLSQPDNCTMRLANKGKRSDFCIPQTSNVFLTMGKVSLIVPTMLSMKLIKVVLPLLALSVFPTVAPAADSYPLSTCVVSGEALGSMGQPIVIHHEGAEVRLCCKGCVKKFNADPAKYLEKLSGKPPQG
jgi:hypothetical protein